METYVHLLKPDEATILTGQEYALESFFNPIQDLFDNWVISMYEVNNCINEQFIWVKNTPIIIYDPKPRIL
jgi:hypothetical protein